MSTPLVAPFVNGAFAPSDLPTVPSRNPARPGEEVARVALSDEATVADAVDAAREAQRAWAALAAPARAEALHRWAGAIQARAEELAQAVVREVGKPIGEARGEVGRCVAILRYTAAQAVLPVGEVVPAQTADGLQFVVRAPVGVVGLVTPWNFPLAIPLWKAAPALALGNAVVLKPSELGGLCALRLAETAAEAGLPAGAFNLVPGDGGAGAALVAHPGVAAVSFTGSVPTGHRVTMAATERGARVQAEMGGKNAALVLADADLGRAANLVAGGAMRFAGQKCTATSRVFVVRSVADAFVAKLAEAVAALPVGDPAEGATAVGPVRTAEKHAELAGLRLDGEVVLRPSVPGEGWFAAPTVVRDVPGDSPLVREELFGPVLAVVAVEDLDEAIERANGVPFGLSASLFTSDLASAMRYVGRIEAGMVRVNADTTGVDPHAPFGGVKASSYGPREQGLAAREFFTETRTVQIQP